MNEETIARLKKAEDRLALQQAKEDSTARIDLLLKKKRLTADEIAELGRSVSEWAGRQ